MSPNVSLDAIRKKYLNDFESRGINLDSSQMERLNDYISKEYQTKVQQELPPSRPTTTTPYSPSIQPKKGSLLSSLAAKATQKPADEFQSLDHLNKLGVGLWYGLESYLWEAPGYILDKLKIPQPYKWEELTGGEKATAVAAGGGALFLPGFGGFRGIAKLGSMATTRIAKEGTIRLGKETAQKVAATASQKSAKLKDTRINQKLTKGWDEVIGKSQNELIGLQAGKEGRKFAVEQLERNLNAAAVKALKDTGIKASDSEL